MLTRTFLITPPPPGSARATLVLGPHDGGEGGLDGNAFCWPLHAFWLWSPFPIAKNRGKLPRAEEADLRLSYGRETLAKLRKLKVALSAAERGQISAAARALRISQPAASRAIRSLEAELGAVLFQRSANRLSPTEAGLTLSRRIGRAFDHLRQAETVLCCAETLARRPLSTQTPDHELLAAIAIAEAGSVSAAARREALSQPGLTRSLRSLETRLGQPLFHRTNDGMQPNPAGEIVVRRAKLAFTELRSGLEELEALRGARGGSLRIGALPLTRSRLVPFAVEAALRRFPEAQIAVLDGTYHSLLHSLRQGDIDIIVGTIRDAAVSGDVSAQRLFVDTMVVVARAGHPLVGRPDLTLHDCLNCHWTMPSKGVPLRTQFEEMLDRTGLPRPAHVVEADSLAVVRTLLSGSDRVGVVSYHQVHYETVVGQLVVLPVDLADIVRPVGWTVRLDHVPTPLMRAFQDELRTATDRIVAPAVP